MSQSALGEVAAELLLLGLWAHTGPHVKRRNAEFWEVRDTDLRCCTSSHGCTDVRTSGGKLHFGVFYVLITPLLFMLWQRLMSKYVGAGISSFWTSRPWLYVKTICNLGKNFQNFFPFWKERKGVLLTLGRGVSSTFWLFWPKSLGQADVQHIERWQSNFPPSNSIDRSKPPWGWNVITTNRGWIWLWASHGQATARLKAGDVFLHGAGTVPLYMIRDKWDCTWMTLHRGGRPLLFLLLWSPRPTYLPWRRICGGQWLYSLSYLALACSSYPNLSYSSSTPITFPPTPLCFKHSHAVGFILPVGEHCHTVALEVA